MSGNKRNIHHHKEEPKEALEIGGTFLNYNEANRHGRIYSEEVAEQMVNQFSELTKKGPVYGELNPDYRSEVFLNNVSHEVKEIHIDSSTCSVEGTIKILDTPKGKLLEDIMKSGMSMSVSSRGVGSEKENGEVENFKILSFDVVSPEKSATGGTIQINDL